MVIATLTKDGKVLATMSSAQPVPNWKSVLMRTLPYGTDLKGATFDIRKES